jgi:hypothetical protein
MATTSNTYTGNGSNKLFSITFPYLETTDVDVYLNGTLQTITTQYTFANATTIEFVAAPANGAVILLDRSTDDAALQATFFPGSSIKAADLNADFDQTLYVVQEINNKKVNRAGDTMTGNLAMSGNKVTGLGTPTASGDAATKGYVDGIAFGGSLDGDRGDITVSGTGTVWTVDNGVIVDAKVNASAGIVSTKLAFTQSGAGATTRTVDSKLKDVVSVKDFGAVCDGTTNDAAAVSAANTAAAGRPLVFPGVTHIGSAVTITCPIVDTMQQLFSITSQVTIDNKLPVRPDWWGDVENTLRYATNALPATGGTVKLANRTYKSNNHAYTFGTTNTTQFFSKDNVLYEGEKMPRLANDCRSLVGGTIIQDMVLAYANNIEFRNLGIDSGKTFCDVKYGGAPVAGTGEGLLLTYPDNATKAAAAIRRGVRLHNVVGLSYSPTTPTHALIIGEGYSDVSCSGEIMGCYGVHGVVIKCANVRAEKLTSFCNNAEGVIIKSDAQATAVAADVFIGQIHVDANGPTNWSPYLTASAASAYGVLFLTAGNNIDRIQVGRIAAYNFGTGISFDSSSGNTISDVQIDSAKIDGGYNSATAVGVLMNYPALRVQFGNLMLRTLQKGMIIVHAGSGFVTSFGNVEAVNIGDVILDIGGAAYVNISMIAARNILGAVARIVGTPKLLFGSVFRDIPGCPMFSSSAGGLVPTLSAGWSQVASANSDVFSITLEGGRICMRGLIRANTTGSSNIFCTLPQWAWPSHNKRFVGQAYNGSTLVITDIVVSTTGLCIVNEVLGTVTNCTTWLSLACCDWTAQIT